MALAVRGRRHRFRTAEEAVAGARQAQGGLAEAQQRAGAEPDRALADGGAVEGRAVRGAVVGDRDPAVRADRHRAVRAGDVRVVERDVGVDGAADPDRPAVQQVHPARVRARHHVQPGGRGLPGPVVGTGDLEGEHGAVDQRGLAEHAAPGVQPLRARVEHGRARGGGLGARDGGGQLGGHGGERRPGRGGDEHVAGARGAVAGVRREDGQPDLHRRQRSLLRDVPGRGTARCLPPPGTDASSGTGRHGAGLPTPSVRRAGGILAPAADSAPAGRPKVILNGRPWAQKCLVGHAFGTCPATVPHGEASSSGQDRGTFRTSSVRAHPREHPADARPATRPDRP